MRSPVGHDVAQTVCERLWRELKAGKHREGRFPYRVIVHTVIGYVRAGWYEQGWGETEWIEIDGPTEDDFTREVELQLTLEDFVSTLPPRDGEVARLWLLEGLEADELAQQLSRAANAVYQSRFRTAARLREWLAPEPHVETVAHPNPTSPASARSNRRSVHRSRPLRPRHLEATG